MTHGATRRSEASPLPAATVAVVGTAICAAVLHLVPDRPSAAAVVPVVFAWGLVAVLRPGAPPPTAWIVATALALRLGLVGTPPLLSDDLYRYLWEGMAWSAGHAPLYEPPASLASLDPVLAAQVTHRELPSVYPPLAMLWFRAVAAVATAPWSVQLGTALADTLTVVSLASLDRRAAWVWALLPVAVLESASGAHIDLPAIALATAGVALWARRPALAGGLWWAGAMVKLFPAVLLPVLLRRLGLRAGAAFGLALTIATVVLALPHARPALPPGLVAYGSHWSFNGFAWAFVGPLAGGLARPILVLAGAAWSLRALRRHPRPEALWAAIASAFVLLSPTVHPWYVLWAVVPDLLCGRRGWALASVALSGSYLVLLAYDPTTGRWAEAPWLWWVTWMPALVALGWGYARSDASPTAP